jgi:hydroxyacylglutathione hydrolase
LPGFLDCGLGERVSSLYFEQFYLGCLAHASYLLGSQGEAVVVDPQRDVDLYVKAAQEHGLTIRHILETHLHADFVFGHKELAARTGAKIYFGAKAGATFSHVAVHDGFELRFGNLRSRFSKLRGTLWKASAWWSPMMRVRSNRGPC